MYEMKTDLSLEEAVALAAGALTPVSARESLPPEQAVGRLLAEDVYSDMDQPPFPRSPLDGYALIAADTENASPAAPAVLGVIDEIFAGGFSTVPVKPGQAARIMTGAPIPAGADCVVRQEDTDEGGEQVKVYTPLSSYQNYCFQGEDFRRGALLAAKGTRLSCSHAALLSAAGFQTAAVITRPRVGLLSTGDELVSCGEDLSPGKIYNSNLPGLTARLAQLGFPPVRAAHTGDDCEKAVDLLRSMAADCDLIVTTGGVSVGKKDIFHQVLPALPADRLFHGVRLKPGTPAIFSLYGGVPILSLSGNPFAALATFELLARPLLARLSGDNSLLPVRTEALLTEPFAKASPGRRFIRARFTGGRVSFPGSGHSSGMLFSMADCNCLIDIPAGSGSLETGQTVSVLLLDHCAADLYPPAARFGGAL